MLSAPSAGKPKPADKIGRSVDAAESAKDRADGRKIVNQHHRAIAVRASVKADRRALPIDRLVAGVARIHLAFAVAQATDKGRGGLLSEDIAVRLPPTASRLLDRLRQPSRHRAKETMAAVVDFIV